jgi:hypothetical protein
MADHAGDALTAPWLVFPRAAKHGIDKSANVAGKILYHNVLVAPRSGRPNNRVESIPGFSREALCEAMHIQPSIKSIGYPTETIS